MICGCWEVNLGPLQEQQVLLMTEPFLSATMSWQCFSMHGQPVYGGSPVVPILGSPRCLCYCHTQGSTVLLYAVYPLFFGPSFLPYPVHSSKQCYLWKSPSFILKHGRSISSTIVVSCSLLSSVHEDVSYCHHCAAYLCV